MCEPIGDLRERDKAWREKIEKNKKLKNRPHLSVFDPTFDGSKPNRK